jgi:hypothetical protein
MLQQMPSLQARCASLRNVRLLETVPAKEMEVPGPCPDSGWRGPAALPPTPLACVDRIPRLLFPDCGWRRPAGGPRRREARALRKLPTTSLRKLQNAECTKSPSIHIPLTNCSAAQLPTAQVANDAQNRTSTVFTHAFLCLLGARRRARDRLSGRSLHNDLRLMCHTEKFCSVCFVCSFASKGKNRRKFQTSVKTSKHPRGLVHSY